MSYRRSTTTWAPVPSRRTRTSPKDARLLVRCLNRKLALAVLIGLVSAAPAFAQQGPAHVRVGIATKHSLSAGQLVVGTIMPARSAVIGSAVDGRVVEFPINEGDRVEAGQPLARLLSDTISLQVQGALAELQLRQEELRELENGSRPEEVRQARAMMESARANTQYMDAKRERAKSLYDMGRTISEEQLQEAVSAAIEAHEAFADATAGYELVVKGPREEKIAQAQARVAMQKALAETLQDQLGKHTIITRFDGYVTVEYTEIGAWVSRGDPVAEVVELDEVDVRVYVLEDHVPYVHVGDSVQVEVPALPSRKFTGRIASVVPQADVRARTFPVKVRIQNSLEAGQPVLKSGMLARVSLPTAATEEAVLVPKDSLVLGSDHPVVWVVDSQSIKTADGSSDGSQQGAVRPVPVEIGMSLGSAIQVRGAIQEGDIVVVEGNERIRPSRTNQPSLVTWPASDTERSETASGGF